MAVAHLDMPRERLWYLGIKLYWESCPHLAEQIVPINWLFGEVGSLIGWHVKVYVYDPLAKSPSTVVSVKAVQSIYVCGVELIGTLAPFEPLSPGEPATPIHVQKWQHLQPDHISAIWILQHCLESNTSHLSQTSASVTCQLQAE